MPRSRASFSGTTPDANLYLTSQSVQIASTPTGSGTCCVFPLSASWTPQRPPTLPAQSDDAARCCFGFRRRVEGYRSRGRDCECHSSRGCTVLAGQPARQSPVASRQRF